MASKLKTMNLPSLSIVTPSYNQGEFIEETINSVLSQGYPNLEYIIVDGGSTDNTHEILEKYKGQISKIIIEPDNGPVDAIRKGWNISDGDILAYLNSDDIYLPGSLEKVANYFIRNEEIKIICGNEFKINAQGFVLGGKSIAEINYFSLLSLCFIPQPAVFLKKNVLEAVGGINVEFNYIFDFELWVRIAKNHCIHSIPDLLAATRWHENTITSNKRQEIGRELDRLLNSELSCVDRKIPLLKRCVILSRLNRLLMGIQLEDGKLGRACKYAIKSCWYLPSYSNIHTIFRKFTYYDLHRKISTAGVIDNVNNNFNNHWTNFIQNHVGRNRGSYR